MSRRGRGKSGMSKAILEQLNLTNNDICKDPNICPPETFPTLTYRPVKNNAERSSERTYMLMVKKDLCEYFENSEYHITLDSKKPDIERYSDRFHCLNSSTPRLHLDWTRFPKELWAEEPSTNKKRRVPKVTPKVNIKRARSNKDVKDVDINSKLEELEQKEKSGEKTEEVVQEEHDGSIVEEEMEEDVDEEMDEGTDYINNYFDDGENYGDDDDDALEEGVF